MKKSVVIGAIVGMSILLSGCEGEYGTFDGSKSDQTNKGNVQTVIVNYDGKPITCIRFNPGERAESLSCDFVKYYNTEFQK